VGAVIPNETSRYALADEVELEDGSIMWTAPEAVGRLVLTDDITHIVVSGDTLFTLAMKYYFDLARPEQYWWAIADYQDTPISDPLAVLAAGKSIIIPSTRTLQEIILNEDRREVDPRMLVSIYQR